MVQVDFTASAEADMQRLDRLVAQRVLTKLRWLAENFEVITPETLTGEWQGVFKLRVGDYRVLYTLDNTAATITVHFVKHRREVYRPRS
jgi:mRNA interferase RelE/StbE